LTRSFAAFLGNILESDSQKWPKEVDDAVVIVNAMKPFSLNHHAKQAEIKLTGEQALEAKWAHSA
jgi:hypothetical protein